MAKNKLQNNKLIWLIILFLIILAGFLIYLKYKPKTQLVEVKQEEKSVAVYCLLDLPPHQIITNENLNLQIDNASSSRECDLNGKLWCGGEEKIIKQCFNVSEKGIALREAILITGGPFLVVYNKTNQNIKIGQEAIKPAVLEFITKIKNSLENSRPENFPALSEFSLISSVTDDVEILTADNWKIYLDASRDADKQSELLFATFKQKGAPKEYVDLRIEGKIYYK